MATSVGKSADAARRSACATDGRDTVPSYANLELDSVPRLAERVSRRRGMNSVETRIVNPVADELREETRVSDILVLNPVAGALPALPYRSATCNRTLDGGSWTRAS
jgi:hypothetical protein